MMIDVLPLSCEFSVTRKCTNHRVPLTCSTHVYGSRIRDYSSQVAMMSMTIGASTRARGIEWSPPCAQLWGLSRGRPATPRSSIFSIRAVCHQSPLKPISCPVHSPTL